jgi:hypothetical protein
VGLVFLSFQTEREGEPICYQKRTWGFMIVIVGITLSFFSNNVWGENLIQYYSNEDGRVLHTSGNNNQGQWSHIVPGSIMEELKKRVCK